VRTPRCRSGLSILRSDRHYRAAKAIVTDYNHSHNVFVATRLAWYLMAIKKTNRHFRFCRFRDRILKETLLDCSPTHASARIQQEPCLALRAQSFYPGVQPCAWR